MEAERLIEAGRVHIDGVVCQSVPHRVQPHQQVNVLGSTPAPTLAPATLLLHKPAGWTMDELQGLLTEDQHYPDRSGLTLLDKHLKGLHGVAPLEPAASGWVVWTQHDGIARALHGSDAQWMEHELLADVQGRVTTEQLPPCDPRAPLNPCAAVPGVRASISQTSTDSTRLRLAIKGYQPGMALSWCEQAGLTLTALKRIRIGRLSLKDLPIRQWRFLLKYEKF
jgi:23S rRNA pseudouridine2604 synthase